MSKFDRQTLSNLENLCKIKLTDSERKEFAEKIKQVLDYAEQLDEVDTKNVPACNFILKNMQQNVFRKDIINNSLDTQTFLSNAPEKISGMIKVFEILPQN